MLLAALAAVCLVLTLAHGTGVSRWETLFTSISGQRSMRTSEGPGITVLIPARNEADRITGTLLDLRAQSLAHRHFQVIVVDDHSTDGTVQLVKHMMPDWPELGLLRLDHAQGKKAAITAGVEAAHFDHLLVSDADVRSGPDRLSALRAHWSASDADLLLMPVQTMSMGGLVGAVQEEEQVALLAAAAASAAEGRPLLANGANMAFTREAFRRVDGYSGDRWASGDDIFLLARMQRSGLRIHYLLERDAVVTTDAMRTWGKFLSQRIRWAGKMRAVGGTWKQLPLLMLPLLLLATTTAVIASWNKGADGLLAAGLMALAWTIWAMPIIRLSRAAWSFIHGESHVHSAPRILAAALAFGVYAPLIALLALFMRPQWKGRRL